MSKALSNLDKASAWLKSFANPDHISHVGLCGEMPNLYFADFKHFQSAFAGKPAKITSNHYSRTYHVIEDGIDFWATEYVNREHPPDAHTEGFVPYVSSS